MIDIPRIIAGNGPRAHWMNQVRSGLASAIAGRGRGYRFRQTSSGTVFDFDQGRGGGSNVNACRFQIREVNGAILDCWKFKDDTTFEIYHNGFAWANRVFQVAIPYDLRNGYPSTEAYTDGTFTLIDTDGLPYTGAQVYTPTGQSRSTKIDYGHSGTFEPLSWTESIKPQYEACREILAIKLPHTGIAGVEWLDLNVGGRHWEKDSQLTQMCKDGYNRLALVVRSNDVNPEL
jgi:hypothetical protein